MQRAAPNVRDSTGIRQLRAILERVGYTPAAVEAALQIGGPLQRDLDETPVYLRRLPEGTPLTTLIKLFQLGVAVDRADAAAALAPLSLSRLARMGLLRVGQGEVEARVEISPVGGLMLVSDRTRRDAARPDHVLGLSPPAAVLAAVTVRQPVASALDLGTGSGIQALLVAQHATRVTATDINPRALRFATFNARLNDVPNIELRQGNLFAPVTNCSFDVIVCNPPYLISPESRVAYRDGGLPGDAFCARLVRHVPAFLREGGFGHVLISWVHGAEQESTAPVQGWLQGSGCDGLLLHYVSYDPLSYAAACNQHLRGDPTAYGQALDRWTDYYARLGIDAIHWGGLILRRRGSAMNWFWAHRPPADRTAPASQHILRLIAAQDYLHGLRDERALLQETLILAEDHSLEQTAILAAGTRQVERCVLRLEGGLQPQVPLDRATVQVLSLLDGRRRLQEALSEVAAAATNRGATNSPTTGTLAKITRLLGLGFLQIVPDQENSKAAERAERGTRRAD